MRREKGTVQLEGVERYEADDGSEENSPEEPLRADRRERQQRGDDQARVVDAPSVGIEPHQLRQTAYDELVRKLRQDAKIEINQKVLQATNVEPPQIPPGMGQAAAQ